VDGGGRLVEHRRPAGDVGRAAQQRRDLGPGGAAVRPEQRVGVEDGDQVGQVAAPGGGEERVDDAALGGRIRVSARRPRAAHPPAGPACELPGGGRRPVDQRRDLLEGQVEQVMQDEREPLGRGQRVQHHQQRQADRVGQHRLVARPGHLAADDRVGDAHAGRVLRPRRPRAQPVEADPGDDGRQPSAGVLHVIRPGAGQAQPGVLERVVGLGLGAEHPVAEPAQARPVLLELPGQPVIAVHRVTSFARPVSSPVVTRRATRV
jgi:hypothetical protein